MAVPIKQLFLVSLTAIIALFGSWHILLQLWYSFLSSGVLMILMGMIAIIVLRVPPPSKEAMESIIGTELCNENKNSECIIKSIAHRGAGWDAPENSLAAFKMCHEKGCNLIEFDIQCTMDNINVVFHDNTLDRLADSGLKIRSVKWDELADVDISVKHPFRERYTPTRIATLDETITQLLSAGQHMIIDIKDYNMKMVKVIHDVFAKYPELYSKAMVSSFFPHIIYCIRRNDPRIVCSLAWRPYAFAYDSYNYPDGRGMPRASNFFYHAALCIIDKIHEWALSRITYYLLGLSVILLHKDAISGRAILEWRQKGVRVMAWTANTLAEKQFLAKALKVTYLTDTLTGENSVHKLIE